MVHQAHKAVSQYLILLPLYSLKYLQVECNIYSCVETFITSLKPTEMNGLKVTMQMKAKKKKKVNVKLNVK